VSAFGVCPTCGTAATRPPIDRADGRPAMLWCSPCHGYFTAPTAPARSRPTVSRALVLVVVLLAVLSGCGASDEDKARDAAARWCERLQADGLLLEPMSRCIGEYMDAVGGRTPR
jgi:hypothetical protein